MRDLVSALAASWNASEMDNWRDCGWSIFCRRDQSKLEVILCQIPEGEWLLQVNPSRVPGFVGKIFGVAPSATPVDVYDLAIEIYRLFSVMPSISNPRWCWDGFPGEQRSTPKPEQMS